MNEFVQKLETYTSIKGCDVSVIYIRTMLDELYQFFAKKDKVIMLSTLASKVFVQVFGSKNAMYFQWS